MGWGAVFERAPLTPTLSVLELDDEKPGADGGLAFGERDLFAAEGKFGGEEVVIVTGRGGRGFRNRRGGFSSRTGSVDGGIEIGRAHV